MADPLARFSGGEVDEVEAHRLLELVHTVAEQHDERDVRLAKLGAGVDHAPTVPGPRGTTPPTKASRRQDFRPWGQRLGFETIRA